MHMTSLHTASHYWHNAILVSQLKVIMNALYSLYHIISSISTKHILKHLQFYILSAPVIQTKMN